MKVNLPKGTRDFGPEEIYKRRYIFGVIRKYFELYGYSPIETPAMENLDTLTGKYGEEGDQLLFKVLNNGDYLAKVPEGILTTKDSHQATKHLSKRGLKYDLTIPFARYAVMNRHQLQLPFKRYQIQPVWRADRPQKGRYQEFYQCDADVIGSDSLHYEAEFVLLYDQVFSELGIEVDIRINNRKLLTALSEKIRTPEELITITTAIDKLDKIGESGVIGILEKSGFTEEKISMIREYLGIKNLETARAFFEDIKIGETGIDELEEIFDLLKDQSLRQKITFDPTLARGLSYYTGAIFEVQPSRVKMGSIGGGGRYDQLASMFGGENMGGVGISFGAERIYDVLEELGFPEQIRPETPVLILTLDKSLQSVGFEAVQMLRRHGIRADLYPAGEKMKKQMKYADRTDADYIVIVGEEEWKKKEVAVKNMKSGHQYNVSLPDAVKIILEKTAKI